MLNLWNTRRLAEDIAAERLTSGDKVAYYVFAATFYMAFAYLGSIGPPHYTWLNMYEGIVVCVVTFVGARRVAATYPDPIDARFFEMSFLLSIPLTIKVTAVLWIGDYTGWWLIGKVLENSVDWAEESARAAAYWGNRGNDLLPFVLAAVVAVVFWLRLAHHVGYVVGKRST